MVVLDANEMKNLDMFRLFLSWTKYIRKYRKA